MCPRFSSEDPYLDMSMETYARIHEAMESAHTVDFTGWGEPMLHGSIYEMIQMAKDKGTATTMTTNGTILNGKNSRKLIDAGLDRLAVSIDGMTPVTYNSIRIGATFEKVTRNLKSLSRLVEQTESSLELAVAFTLQEDNAPELELIVPWMKSVGARVLHLKHLNVISNSEDWKNSFIKYLHPPVQGNGHTLGKLEERIASLTDACKSAGICLNMHSEFPMTSEMKGRHCLATPLDSVYFSYEGRVSPCCHFGHHVSRYFEGTFYPPSSLFYGDIRLQTFQEVWNDPEFQAFRKGFITQEFPEACRTCYLLYGK